MHCTKSIVFLGSLLALCCLAAVQAGAIGRKGVEGKNSVEVTDKGVTVKSGREGYVSTNALVAAEDRKDTGGWLSSSQLDGLKAMVMYKSSFLPMIGLKFIVKIFLHLVVALGIGVATATALCSFTPLCNISFEGSKPAFLSGKKDILPQLQEALERVAQISHILKRNESPVEAQPAQQSAVAEATAEASPVELPLDARSPQKNLDDESQTTKPEAKDVKENEA